LQAEADNGFAPARVLSLGVQGGSMASHKYEVGQNVRFNPSRTSSLVGYQEGKIVRLLPIEEGSYLYRIKCVAENVERVVKEGDLALRSLDWRGQDTGKLASVAK
jgi:hypothetical protein